MDNAASHPAPCSVEADNDELVARLYELANDSAANDAELQALDAIVYDRLLQTYGDDVTAPLEA